MRAFELTGRWGIRFPPEQGANRSDCAKERPCEGNAKTRHPGREMQGGGGLDRFVSDEETPQVRGVQRQTPERSRGKQVSSVLPGVRDRVDERCDGDPSDNENIAYRQQGLTR